MSSVAESGADDDKCIFLCKIRHFNFAHMVHCVLDHCLRRLAFYVFVVTIFDPCRVLHRMMWRLEMNMERS